MKNYKTLLFLFILSVGSIANADNYRILLTNDDGIESPLLIALAHALSTDYEVVISAPRENQSGSSHATNSSAPLKVEKIMLEGELQGYGVHGRPADAARFGILHFGADKPFDLVVSGINRGANVGNVAHLSGTVGAAMEGVYQGLPAIAVSQDARANTDISIAITRQVIQQLREQALPKGIVVSINVPAGEVKEVVAKPMGGSYLGFRPYEKVSAEGNSETFQSGLTITRDESQDNDTRAYQQGKATVTPLRFDWTDTPALSTITNWHLTVSE